MYNKVISETVPQVFKEAVLKYADRVAMRKKDYGLWHDISWNEYYQKESERPADRRAFPSAL